MLLKSAHTTAPGRSEDSEAVERNERMLARLSTFLNHDASNAAAARVLRVVGEPLNHVVDVARLSLPGEDLSNVDLGAMVATLSSLLYAADSNSDLVMLSVHAEPVRAQITLARPILLVAYELISNALQHAFPVGRAGNISVTLFESGGKLRTTVADDGVGLPIGYRSRGGGINFIEQICTESGGEMELQTEADAQLTRLCCCCKVVGQRSESLAFGDRTLPN